MVDLTMMIYDIWNFGQTVLYVFFHASCFNLELLRPCASHWIKGVTFWTMFLYLAPSGCTYALTIQPSPINQIKSVIQSQYIE